MANLQTSLNEAICAHAAPAASEYALRDARQPNLSLRVRPCGSKTWIVRRRAQGRSARISIGSYPDIGVKEARRAASSITAVRPSASPRTLRFGAFCAEHERRHGLMLKPSGLRTYRSYVRTQLLPVFGRRHLDRITRVEVVRWFERYSARSPGGANRALGIFGQMLECAKRWDRLPSDWINPVNGIRENRRRAIGGFLSKAQMARLGTALAARSARGCTAAEVLWALMLTGCRVGELLDLRWGDVLPDRLRLRDSKTGPREVPLGSAAARFFKACRRRLGRDQGSNARVFTFDKVGGYERVRTVWRSVRKAAGLPPTLRVHDLRHSFASHAVMAGESLFVVSRLLGHRRVQTTARYAHLADHALLGAAELIGALLMKQAAPRAQRRGLFPSLRTREGVRP